tara:strand:+ start:362 stop:730 length:369 start_codon:yes stop_codon:yes gene_type:complete
MNKNKEKLDNQFDDPPKLLINIYGILAILFIIIPEWMAEIAITLGNGSHEDRIPIKSNDWNTKPDLKLSTMNIRELRHLAKELKIHGYSNENQQTLSKRILKKLNSRISKKGKRVIQEWNKL